MDKFLNISLKNIAWFNEINQNGNLCMSPSYQRNAVWSERQKSYLIDSILNGYPIPEIYIQEDIDENGVSKFIVVDGQQRLRAVLEFLDNQFKLNPVDSPMFNGARFCDLSSEQKKTFFRYNFIVRTIPEMEDSEIRGIFKRLNLNVVSLNKQEIRKAAYSGGFIKLVKELSVNRFWTSMHLFSANDIKRMRDEQFISELSLLAVEGITNKKDRLEQFYIETEMNFPQRGYLIETFNIVFDILTPMADELSKTRWRNKTDFYTLFLGLSNLRNNLGAIKEKSTQICAALINFSNQVYECLKVNDGEDIKYPSYIRDYTKGVRASTDYQARNIRQNAFEQFLLQIITAE